MSEIIDRLNYAMKQYHNSQEWYSEGPNGEEIDPDPCYYDWICEAASEWRSVEKDYPKDETPVIVKGGIAYYSLAFNTWFSLTGIEYPGKAIEWEVTHWMPLHSPPKSE